MARASQNVRSSDRRCSKHQACLLGCCKLVHFLLAKAWHGSPTKHPLLPATARYCPLLHDAGLTDGGSSEHRLDSSVLLGIPCCCSRLLSVHLLGIGPIALDNSSLLRQTNCCVVLVLHHFRQLSTTLTEALIAFYYLV